MIRAVGLVRVSSDEQAKHGYSLPDQSRAIRAYCERQGYVLSEVLEDDGVTGRMSERPAVKRALELTKAGVLDRLVLCKIDRVGRETRVIQDLLYRFRNAGLRVEFVEHVSGDTPEERLLLNTLGGLAEYEWEQIRARTMMGRRRKAESGRMPVAFNLFGYELVRKWEEEAGQGRSGEIRIRDAEAALVRELFQRYTAGESLSALVKWLNASGHLTRRGNEWRVTTLKLTLTNPAYIGQARYGWRQVTSYVDDDRKRFRVREQDQWVVVPCPPLVDPATFAAAQDRLRTTAEQIPGRPSHIWPLRGCVQCETCVGKRGLPVKAVGQRKTSNPARKSYAVRAYECRSCRASIGADKWEPQAKVRLLAQLQPGVQRAAVLAEIKRERSRLGDAETLLERHQAELRAIDSEERKLMELALTFSTHLVAERAVALRTRRETAQARIQELLGALARVEDPERLAESAEAAAERLRKRVEQASAEELSSIYRQHLTIIIRKHRSPKFLVRR